VGGIGIIYGSSTGNTKDVALQLQEAVGGEIHDVAKADASTFESHPFLILVTSTWGMGELQDDWEDFLPSLDSIDLSGKKVAIMGLGDQVNYSDTFCDSMLILAEKVVERGAVLVGATPVDGYSFDNSRAVKDGHFVGLAIDEDSQSDKTAGRIREWAAELKREFA